MFKISKEQDVIKKKKKETAWVLTCKIKKAAILGVFQSKQSVGSYKGRH